MIVTEINIAQFQEQFEQSEQPFLLVDVREIDEYEDARIPGSINIPLSEFQMRMSEIRQDLPVVMVCARGSRSAMAADYMLAHGYQDVYNLLDGTIGWLQQGLPYDQG